MYWNARSRSYVRVFAAVTVAVGVWLLSPSVYAENNGDTEEQSAADTERAQSSSKSEKPEDRPSSWVRRFAEFGGGVGGFYTGTVAGLGLGFGIDYLRQGEDFDLSSQPSTLTAVMVIAGATFGAPAGTTLLGKPFDAHGTYGGALSGGLVGSIAGVWVGSNLRKSQIRGVFVPLWAVGTSIGTTVGYEVVHSRRTSWMSRVRFTPVSTMTPGARSFGFSFDFR